MASPAAGPLRTADCRAGCSLIPPPPRLLPLCFLSLTVAAAFPSVSCIQHRVSFSDPCTWGLHPPPPTASLFSSLCRDSFSALGSCIKGQPLLRASPEPLSYLPTHLNPVPFIRDSKPEPWLTFFIELFTEMTIRLVSSQAVPDGTCFPGVIINYAQKCLV